MATSAPNLIHADTFFSLPAVAKTREPILFASWIAVVPIPEEPPWTKKRSPAFSLPRTITFDHTVKKVSGKQAACFNEKPSGIGKQ